VIRVLNGIMAVLFVVSAALQWNDPDPLEWAAMYLAAATACGLFALGRREAPYVALAVCAVAVVWAATLLPSVVGRVAPSEMFESMQAKDGMVEVARESGGLLIVAAWSATIGVLGLRRARPRAMS
jgi:hypothetical protein